MQDESKEGSWFLIMASWEMGADDKAIKRFHRIYKYLNIRAPGMDGKPEQRVAENEYNNDYREVPLVDGNDPVYDYDIVDVNDPVHDIVGGSLMPLNLIGRRKFVIIFQIKPDKGTRVLQTLSKKISLGAPISVEIFPATHVHDLIGVLPPQKKL